MTNRKQPFEVTIDSDADAAYIKMTGRAVAESREIGGGIIVDLDDMGIVVGIEILGLETVIPFQRLTDEFHVHTADVEYLRILQPSISGFLVQYSSDGSTHQNTLRGSMMSRELVHSGRAN